MALELDVVKWAEQEFGTCQLGDARLTARAVKMAQQFAAHSSGSTPEQTESWGDCKGTYRLIDNKKVSFEALATPHWEQTLARTQGHFLLLNDTTTISFDGDRQISGMGIVSSGSAKGYMLHSALMVDAGDGEVIGLGRQLIYYRQAVPKKETQRQRLLRERESEIWGKVIDQIGPAPNDQVRFTHVCDRGADNFEVYCHLLRQRTDWVVRAAQLKRLVQFNGEKLQLREHLKSLPVQGTYQLAVPENEHQRARTATMEVRFSTVGVPVPRDCGRFAKESGITLIMMNVVEVLEVNPPKGCKRLQWVLFTSHEVQTLEQALAVVGYYELRPLVEEFHKALKTGCRIEDRLYETSSRWENLTAMLSIIAVRLLQLKTIAVKEPDRPAIEVVPQGWLQMLHVLRGPKRKKVETARDFVRALAGLGGHLGRKSDGQPGWITIWRGFNKLHLLLRGAAAMNKRCG
jgi:hypothetical protein